MTEKFTGVKMPKPDLENVAVQHGGAKLEQQKNGDRVNQVATQTWAVDLPWPPRELSPNARQHYHAAARAKKAYRARCGAIATQAGGRVLAGCAGRLRVHLAFFPPDRRPRDWDNLLASMKSGLDGLADATGVDDSRWSLSFELGEPVPGGQVLVTFTAAGA